jgi:transposase
MKYYAGLDVSLEETSVCIVNQDGDIVREGKAPTDPEPLAAFLEATGLVFDRVGFEAGPGSAWLYKGLAAAGLPVFCIETRHAHAALKAQNVKTDRNDARGIAHMMRTGWFKATHVKTSESQKQRVLLNNRRSLVEKRLDIENQIRGTLKVFGLKVGRVTAARYEPRIRELIADDEELQAYLEPLLEVRRHMAAQCRRLEKMILDMVKQDAVCRRFMTIPGVGPLTALLFKTSIDDPHRFRKSANVGVHLGLTPRKYASGQVDYDGRIIDDARPEMERSQGLGHARCPAQLDEKRLRGRGAQAGGHHAPDVDRRDRLQVRQRGGSVKRRRRESLTFSRTLTGAGRKQGVRQDEGTR